MSRRSTARTGSSHSAISAANSGGLGLQLGQRQRRQLHDLRGPVPCARSTPATVVGAAERHALGHQVIGELGREQVPFPRPRAPAAARLEAEPGAEPGHHTQARAERLDRVVERLLRFLQILVVGERQPLQNREQRDQVAVHPAGLAADQLGNVRVDLLRHDRRARTVGFRELDEAKLLRRPDDQLLADSREMGLTERARRDQLDGKIAVGHSVDAVVRHAREAKLLGHRGAIDGKSGRGERAGAERALVGTARRVDEATAIASEHGHVRKQVVRQPDRLRALQVRVTWSDRVDVLPGLDHERAAQAIHVCDEATDRGQGIEPEIGRDLIVPAASSVQSTAGRADLRGRARASTFM